MIRGRFRSQTVRAGALAVGVGVLALSGIALAGGGSKPPWESSVSPAPNGRVVFYNAKGQVVTGGPITASGFGAFAAASTGDIRAGDTKATLFVYTPVANENPGLWSGEQISISSDYPNKKAPAPLGTATSPV